MEEHGDELFSLTAAEFPCYSYCMKHPPQFLRLPSGPFEEGKGLEARLSSLDAMSNQKHFLTERSYRW